MGAGAGRDLESLLSPTLAAKPGAAALYSVRASFFVAFFGGPYAASIFGYLNSRKLGREREDAWLYGGIALVWTAAMIWVGQASAAGTLPPWLQGAGDSASIRRFIPRVASLLVFGGIYLRLKPFFKAAEMSGQSPPNPWGPGLATVVAAAAMSMLAVFIGTMLPR